MGLYSKIIFPRLLDVVMSDETLIPYRRQALQEVEGKVLEVGLGTGLNLPYYPEKVEKIVGIDPNPGMNQRAQKRLDQAPAKVEIRRLSGESLPFPDDNFDCVVSTWTLCSIPDIQQALGEIYRVLRPQGKFVFVEHGLSPEPGIQTWQNLLNPLQKRIGDGCNLNRNMAQFIQEAGFELTSLENTYLERTPKIMGYLYQGIALKPD